MATINVPGDHATITLAIAAAVAGDTILVAAGTYAESIDITKGVILKSADGPVTTIIDGTSVNDAVIDSSSSNRVRIDGFKITGGSGKLVGNQRRGGGVYASGPVTLNDCDITLNTAAGGGGIYLEDAGASEVTKCTIDLNVANGRGNAQGGSGIHAHKGTPWIDRCAIQANTCKLGASGGGVLFREVANGSYLVSSLLDRNTGRLGGGIFIRACSPVVINCTLAKNEARDNGGGIFATDNGTVRVRNSILWVNTGSNGTVTDHVTDATTAAGHDLPELDYCIVEGGWSGRGGNNMANDPLFQNLAINAYTLRAGSPAIDAGNNGYLPTGSFADLARNTRIATSNVDDNPLTSAVDIGAYEKQPAVSDPAPAVGVNRQWQGSAVTISIETTTTGAVT
jgi:predicted outer membrane repeat protein